MERRRNAYADHCYVCSANVPAGDGWLYSDTGSSRARSRHRSSGRWPKRVKCGRCHQHNLAHKWQAKNLDNPKPATPRLGVVDIRKGRVEAGHWTDPRWPGLQNPCVYWVLPDGRKEIIVQHRPITGEPIAVQVSYYTDRLWFGCELTDRAALHLERLAEQALQDYAEHMASD